MEGTSIYQYTKGVIKANPIITPTRAGEFLKEKLWCESWKLKSIISLESGLRLKDAE